MADEHLKSDADVESILRLAVQEEHESAATLRDRLQQSASELGISPEALAAAETKYREQRESARNAELEKQEVGARRRRKLRGFLQHLTPYIGVCSMLFLINLFTGHQTWWFIFPVFGWGIGVVSHGIGVLTSDGSEEHEDSHNNGSNSLADQRSVRKND